jgi:glyoxylase-like metal-dependent hydrolase (beta-lactamase superfamily II)
VPRDPGDRRADRHASGGHLIAAWRWEILVPAHRIALALLKGEIVEVRGSTSAGTFAAYRGIPDAVHGMIAWPNTVLLMGPEPIVVDPGYQTQGDMLVGALAARSLAPDDIRAVVMTHLHSDHLSALPQLGDVELFVHEAELDTPYARRQQGLLDAVTVNRLSGAEGEIRPDLRWIHTPGHAPGHIAVIAECHEERVIVAGDTLGPDPGWFDRMDPPESLPERDAHLDAFRRIRACDAHVIVPGHNPPFRLRETGT